MGYYLLDNRNPHGPHFYSSRRAKLRVIVLHITAGLEDLDMSGRDASAEQTARYAATTERQVSWHAGADSDSWLSLLPASYTAWHVRNYNSPSWGLEISKRDTTWSDEPKAWVEATLRNAAAACQPIAKKYGIPLRLLTRAQVDAGMFGFTYHMWLDPTRRSDPGKDFPIDQFFALMRGEEDDMPLTDADVEKIWTTDGIIPNHNSTNDNKFWAPHTHIAHIEDTQDKEYALLKTVAKQLTAVRAELASHDDPDRLRRLIREAVEGIDFGDLAADEVAGLVVSKLGERLADDEGGTPT